MPPCSVQKTYPFCEKQAGKDGIDADFGTLCGRQTFHQMKACCFGDGVAHATAALADALGTISGHATSVCYGHTATDDDMRKTPPSGFMLNLERVSLFCAHAWRLTWELLAASG
jgi:hypothetical protein